MSQSPKHIVHFLMDARRAGPLVVVENLIGEQRKTASVEVWTCGRGELTDRALIWLRRPLRAFYLFEMVLNFLMIAFCFIRETKRRDLVFHVHGEQNFAPVAAASLLRVPLVWHFHSTHDVYGEGTGSLAGSIFAVLRSWVMQLRGRTAFAFVASARATKDVWKLPASAVIVPTPIDPELWKPTGNALASGPVKAICVANLYPLKGQDVLMEALALLDDIELHATLIGAEFPVHQAYAAGVRAKSTGLAVTLAGPKSGDEVRQAMGESDVFVMPSRTEACPVALIEAAAMGLPVIASRVGDVEVLVGADYPFLVPPQDPQALADAIRSFLVLSRAERKALGMQLRERVVGLCSSRSVAARFAELYSSLG